MALPANAQEGICSSTAEGIYLESEKDSATVMYVLGKRS